MYSENVTVVNATGIHARPASQFSKMAAGFQSNVTVKKSDAEGDGVNANDPGPDLRHRDHHRC